MLQAGLIPHIQCRLSMLVIYFWKYKCYKIIKLFKYFN